MPKFTTDELLARIAHLEKKLDDARNKPAGAPAPEAQADIWFLLDRSGSMASIAQQVVEGFDNFFAEQSRSAGRATVTLVQFDSEAPQDVLIDAQPLDRVFPIRDLYKPRGTTPLYDAIALLMDRAERHVAKGANPADQLFVIFTDGEENASREWTAERIHARIDALRKAGWTFVFLGANQDSYATGAKMAMAVGSLANFSPTAAGVQASYASLNRSVSAFRTKARAQRKADADDFFGGIKESEDEMTGNPQGSCGGQAGAGDARS